MDSKNLELLRVRKSSDWFDFTTYNWHNNKNGILDAAEDLNWILMGGMIAPKKDSTAPKKCTHRTKYQ
jgi:hypothetical protein